MRTDTNPRAARSRHRRVVGAGLSRQERAFAADGLSDASCTFVDTFDELEENVELLARFHVLVVGSRDARGRDPVAMLSRVAAALPETALVALHARSARSVLGTAPLQSLVLAGVHEIVFDAGAQTPAALSAAARNAQRDIATEVVFSALRSLVPLNLRPLIRLVVAQPERIRSVPALAAAVSVTRRTLVNRCALKGGLPPAELIAWCRLAMVGYLLGRTDATIESIAMSLRFASPTALRNVIKRYTGYRATAIRSAGGLGAIVDALRRRMRARG